MDSNRPQSPNDRFVDTLFHEAGTTAEIGTGEEEVGELDTRLLNFAKAAVSEARTFHSNHTRTAWERSYKAFRNEHSIGSKYLTGRWKQRSKIFRPKTRVAVRKTDAVAAQALFATPDVVTIGAQRKSDLRQRASAAVIQALLEYRMDRQSGRAGMPWFQISMAARQDSQITGICVSKQHWEYEEKPTGTFDVYEDIDEDGNPVTVKELHYKAIKDRPMCTPIPPENILIDPAASFIDPVGTSAFFIIRYPYHADDAATMLKRGAENERSNIKWREVKKSEFLRGSNTSNYDAKSVRQSREGGQDRLEYAAANVGDLDIVWLHENFIRLEGEDYHFWSIEDHKIISDPIPVEEAYPEQHGDRPIVMGYGSLESHRLFPMGTVEATQQLQQEANDIANLRLDNIKNIISPTAKVKRGKRVDLRQVQNRSPDSVLQLDDVDDVVWDGPRDVTASSYQEQDRLNADFDDVAGTFSGGSVMTNRQLNETVGGMKMLSGSANAVSEFDLRVWIETWAEPVVRQIVRLEQYWESDATILAIAGDKAKLFDRYGIDQITDDLLETDVTVRVNVGIGAADPMQQLEKLKIGAGMIAEMYGVEFLHEASKPHEFVAEVFGKIGYKDSERFWDFEKLEKGPSRKEKMMMKEMERLQKALDTKQVETKGKLAVEQARGENQIKAVALQAGTEMELGRLKGRVDLSKQIMSQEHDVGREKFATVRDGVKTLAGLINKPKEAPKQNV